MHIDNLIAIIAIVFFTLLVSLTVEADQIVHKFKSPSFSGEATSSHYLTIENQEHSRKLTIKSFAR